MDAYAIQKWERTKEIAKACGVTFKFHNVNYPRLKSWACPPAAYAASDVRPADVGLPQGPTAPSSGVIGERGSLW